MGQSGSPSRQALREKESRVRALDGRRTTGRDNLPVGLADHSETHVVGDLSTSHGSVPHCPTSMDRMDAATVWKFLHIAAMFLAVSIFVGQGMLSGAVARSGDVAATRRVLSVEDRFAPVGGAMFLLGIVFGFVAGIIGDFDLTQTWLLIAYVLAAFILVNGLTYHRAQAEKFKAAADAGDGDGVRALASAPSATLMNVIDGIAWLAIIYVMVAKPFS
jgi:uncharacterized membrane protein